MGLNLARAERRGNRPRHEHDSPHYGWLCRPGKLLRRRFHALAWDQRLDVRLQVRALETNMGRQPGWLSRFRWRLQRWTDDSPTRGRWSRRRAYPTTHGMEEHLGERTRLELGILKRWR